MFEGANANKTEVVAIASNLFIFFTALYLLTYAWHNSDASQLRIEVARSIAESSDMAVPSGTGIKGADGRDYSWFGIGSVLLYIPFYIVEKAAGIPHESLFDLIILLVCAATPVLIFFFSISLGYSRRASIFTSIFYGLGTMAWYYSKDPSDHGLEAFFILLSAYFMYRHATDKQVIHLIFSALSIGIAFITRQNSILIIPSLFMLMVLHNSKQYDLKTMIWLAARNIALFVLCLIPFICLIFWYNYYRFGSVFETGHGLIAKRLGVDFFTGTPIFTGLFGFLASPGEGFFYYSPVAILFLFSIRPFYRKHPVPALSFILIIILYLLFFSKNKFWHGAIGWGPRYIFAVTPFLIIPIAEMLDSPFWSSKPFSKLFVCVVFAVSMVVQIASVSVHQSKYYVYLLVEKNVRFEVIEGQGVQSIKYPPPEIFFDWQMSPILARFKFIREMGRNMEDYKYAELPAKAAYAEKIKADPAMNIFDFWWLYKYFLEGSYSGFISAGSLFLIAILTASRLRGLLGKGV